MKNRSCLVLFAVFLPVASEQLFAGALELDGNGDIVTFPGTGIPSGPSPFTIETWINPTTIPTGGENGGQITFWGNQSGNQANGFRLRGASGVRHYFWGNDHDENFGSSILGDTTGPNGDGWHHVAITWDGTQTRWYWNGIPLGNPRSAAGVNVASVNHRIGSRLDAEFFHGFIDELRIWSVARSQTELSDNMTLALTGNEPNLVAYWDFEGDMVDRAGGDNNGTPVGNAQINAAVSAPIQTSGPRITSFTATPSPVYEAGTLTFDWQVDAADVTGTLTVQVLDQGGAVLHTTSSAAGSHPIVIGATGGLAGAATYTLRASESGGQMVSRESTVEVMLLPGIPVADPQTALQTTTTTPLPITLTGSDPNNHPNAQLTFSIVTSPSGGTLSGTAPNVTYTANVGFSGPDAFTFKVNDGKYDSPPGTVSINVVALPSPPSDILLSTTSIAETVAPAGFIAALSSVDLNPEDTHSYSLVPGSGDTHNGLFSIDANRLEALGNFAGQVGNSYSIRVRSTDNGGLSFEKSFVLTVIEVVGDLVINEIHYNPPDNTVRQEFIEIYNPGNAVADLTGWRVSGAVDYLFPNGTTLSPGAYLVVAEDPATMLLTFEVTTLGPYTGSLDSDGENLRLRDALDKVVDEVDYSLGFPWPTAANGNGPSIELIHPGLNNANGSSWRSSSVSPTPGAQNSVFAENAPPSIRQVSHSPDQPNDTQQVVIMARVTDPDLVASVVLEYQVVTPGAYIPSHLPHTVSGGRIQNFTQPHPENPAYNDPANWTMASMADAGLGADALAGDGIYTVILPAQAHRTLVRYRITVEDALGNSARVPYPDDQRLNFAYFVYSGVPDYNGHAAATLTALPVYHVVTRAEDWSECMAWNNTSLQIGQGGLDRFHYNWMGTIVYDGVVYDNIRYRLRGANGRYHQNAKRSMRFRMNDGDLLQARDQEGKNFNRKWRTLTTTKGFENRQTLTYALNEAINMYLWDKMGLPAQNTLWVHWRVIDGADEAPDPWRGDFWGLNFLVETYDVNFLDEHNLPKGSMYKLINQTRDAAQQLRYQGAFAPANGQDHDNIEDNLTGNSTPDFIRAHVDLDKYYLYHSLSEAIRNYDFWPDANKNMVYYFYPEYTAANGFRGKLWILPWDSDATWGPTWNSGHDVVYNSIFPASGGGSDGASNPVFWPDYYNAVRQLRDLIWQEDQINPLIDDFAATIAPFIPADSDRWKNAPADAGSYDGPSPQGPLGGAGRISLEALVQDFKNFAFVGGSWPGGTVGVGGRAEYLDSLDSVRGEGAQIPATPSISYVGTAGFPVDGLFFESTAFSDPQGDNTFGAIEWRVAEIENTNAVGYVRTGRPKLEWNASWTSGELTTFNNRIQVPPAGLKPGATYRARVRHRDDSGRWSHWSAPFRFSAVRANVLSDLQASLVISEIMYNPPPAGGFQGDDLEWLELKNTGTTTLDLSGLFFDQGIDFTFPFGTMLPPSGTIVLASTPAAFSAMNPGVVVGGDFSGKLDNGGETLRIRHPHQVTILSVTYDDEPPWPAAADGYGFSLVRDPVTGVYRASSEVGGSPGADDPASTIPQVVINEVLSGSTFPAVDAIELHNPGGSAADVGGWYLTDDRAQPRKYRIPQGTMVPVGGYLVLDETHFNQTPGVGTSFSLSSAGEEVYLFSANAAFDLIGYSHGVAFPGSAPDATFGRYINSIGEEQFPAQITPSLGSANSGPAVGPVVISEIMYNPDNYWVQFVEIRNISGNPVPLYDMNAPSNTWRINGIGFEFPPNITLPAGATFLVTLSGPNPVGPIPPGPNVFGPAPGTLQNDGERLELQRPSPVDANGFHYYSVDGVRYDDNLPWPPAADGGGASLQRLNLMAYGDDPANWDAAIPTPGASLPTGAVPTITVPPTDLVAVALTEAMLSVSATGAGPLRYQWMFNRSNIAGGTNRVLVIPSVLPADAGRYSVAVYNQAGSVTSPEAEVSVEVPAEITRHPQGAAVFPGTNVTLRVEASSTSLLRYQWRKNGINVLGATNDSLTIMVMQEADGGEYNVEVTDAVGAITSQVAKLLVLIRPAFVRSPASIAVPVGGTMVLSVEMTGTLPMGYRWRRGGQTILSVDLNSHTSFLVIPDFQANNAGPYSVVVTNQAFFTPGVLSSRADVVVATDSDGDLIPDDYENSHGMDPGDPADASLDVDGDGLTALEEYLAGTDPSDPTSYLRVEKVSFDGGVTIRFHAIAGVTYTVQFGPTVDGPWTRLVDVPGQPVDGQVVVTDPAGVMGQRYYRLVTPVMGVGP